MISSDGITWNYAGTYHGVGQTNSSVCWSPELKLFVAIAYDGTYSRPWTSPDGSTWTVQNSADNTVSWKSICWCPKLGIFMSGGETGGNVVKTQWSSNGSSWSLIPAPPSSLFFRNLIWSDELSLFVASGSAISGSVATSLDGFTWSYRYSLSTGKEWIGLCYSPQLNMFVACSSTSTLNSMLISSL